MLSKYVGIFINSRYIKNDGVMSSVPVSFLDVFRRQKEREKVPFLVLALSKV